MLQADSTSRLASAAPVPTRPIRCLSFRHSRHSHRCRNRRSTPHKSTHRAASRATAYCAPFLAPRRRTARRPRHRPRQRRGRAAGHPGTRGARPPRRLSPTPLRAVRLMWCRNHGLRSNLLATLICMTTCPRHVCHAPVVVSPRTQDYPTACLVPRAAGGRHISSRPYSGGREVPTSTVVADDGPGRS